MSASEITKGPNAIIIPTESEHLDILRKLTEDVRRLIVRKIRYLTPRCIVDLRKSIREMPLIAKEVYTLRRLHPTLDEPDLVYLRELYDIHSTCFVHTMDYLSSYEMMPPDIRTRIPYLPILEGW